ncbi:V-type ATP synthase subunit D [bacterium]|nr:V-type ATP synthase subunit D [bacterium]
MARLEIAPTKTNLLDLKQQHSFATEGHTLLNQKRDILLAELMGMMGTAAEIEERVDKLLAAAYDQLDTALISMGKKNLRDLSRTMPIETMVEIATRKIMGISVPNVKVYIDEKKPYYGLLNTTRELDQAVASFREILDLLGRLAQTRITVVRLAKEVQKTTRRVNALEKIYLPDYNESIKYIQDVLDEADRESFFVMKLMKKRLKKNKRA